MYISKYLYTHAYKHTRIHAMIGGEYDINVTCR